MSDHIVDEIWQNIKKINMRGADGNEVFKHTLADKILLECVK